MFTAISISYFDGTVTLKTNAARLLDQMGIHYELREYKVDPEDLAAAAVAAKIGLPPGQLFKTLVAQGDRQGICMAVIPGVWKKPSADSIAWEGTRYMSNAYPHRSIPNHKT